jgi:hypothetical protein
MTRLAADAAIADRIQIKLRQLGLPPPTFGLPPGQVLVYLTRFLSRAVVPGGPRRWYHIARSLVPALRNPRLIPFAVVNWVHGLAIQAFVRELLKQNRPRAVADTPRACSMLECPTA